jgi:predicted RNA-binding Zn-ribbon protein involved in translation (DUF1610 family)
VANEGLCVPCKRGYRRLTDDGKNEQLPEKAEHVDEKPFICPECGGTHAASWSRVGVTYLGDSPWDYVAARETCGSCGTEVPRSLSRRWNLDTAEEAQVIWREKFRRVELDAGPT